MVDQVHDDDLWGVARTSDKAGTVRLANLVRHCCAADDLPLLRAAEKVLEGLIEPRALPLYMLKPGDFCEAVPDSMEWELDGEPGVRSFWEEWRAPPERLGTAGALAWLRRAWLGNGAYLAGEADREGLRDAHLDRLPGGALAILESDAAAAFGYGKAVAPVVDTRVVQPAGGAWPHAAGPWTDVERDALRSMREAGMNDGQIGSVAGCSRQVVAQQIGARKDANPVGAAAFEYMRKRA